MNSIVIGIDEAGRGALAGPVVVCAACILKPEAITHIKLNDSKAMTSSSRAREYRKIKDAVAAGHIKFAHVSLTNEYIDKVNILEATCMGASMCLESLMCDNIEHNGIRHFTHNSEFDWAHVLIDGSYDLLKNFKGDITKECVIKDDSKIPEIMLASIIAKCWRDHHMEDYAIQYPGYDFAKSKGYPSPKHMQAIIDLGPCEIHRKTFKRVKEYVVK